MPPSCRPGRPPSTSAAERRFDDGLGRVCGRRRAVGPRRDNVSTALEAAGASLADVIQWTVFISEDADLNAAYGAIAPRLATGGAPPLVTAALVAGLGVPGALIEVSAIGAVFQG